MTKHTDTALPIISLNPHVQLNYLEMRRSGVSHNLAEMFALRRPPSIETDATFLAGECNGSQFEKQEATGDYYKQVAAEHGVDVKGKVYKSGLARFPGDPEAWISGKDDVRRVCETRGWGCDGMVKVKARNDVAPKEDVDVAHDIVEERVMHMMDQDPDTVRRPVDEVFAEAKAACLPGAA